MGSVASGTLAKGRNWTSSVYLLGLIPKHK